MPIKIPYTKPSLTYSQQLNQLKQRGLFIENESKASYLLRHISYYRLSGYWYPLLAEPKSSHTFKKNATFDKAFKIYCFDREFRQLVLSELEKIEVAVRAQVIHKLSTVHGPFWFLDNNLFSNRNKLAKSIRKLRSEYSRSDEEFIKSFRNKYSDSLPPNWMILEISSFGNLSTLYSNLKSGRNKRDIAKYFGLDDQTFESWLHSFTYIRNLCAHHSRLWNKQLGIRARLPNNPRNQFLQFTYTTDSSGRKIYFNKKVYYVLSMLIYLLNIVNSKHTFQKKFNTLLIKYPSIDLNAMGFPDNWKDELIWNWKAKGSLNLIERIIVRIK